MMNHKTVVMYSVDAVLSCQRHSTRKSIEVWKLHPYGLYQGGRCIISKLLNIWHNMVFCLGVSPLKTKKKVVW